MLMPIQRQSTLALTDENWDALNKAISKLRKKGVYGELVQTHAAMVQEPDGFQHSLHRMHGRRGFPVGYQRFLPWHRAYLIVFERRLREIDDSLAIPYWDWNADGGRLEGFPDPADAQFPAGAWYRNPGTRQGEKRQPGRASWFTRETDIQRAIQTLDNYDDFTRWLERHPHNRGHGWIGGDMALVMTAPRDPAFWFHHAQVDRLWAQWQEEHRNQMANLSGTNAQLDPWYDAGNPDEFTVKWVDNIRNLGPDSYEYADPPNRREVV